MNVQELAAYCLSKPYTMETYPFDEVTMVIKVADKMFALIPTDSPSSINVKHNTDEIPTLIEQYEGIKPG